jgi:hypothetical protein
MSPADILTTMQAAGRPLSDLVGVPQRGIGRLATARLLADKATRDQMVFCLCEVFNCFQNPLDLLAYFLTANLFQIFCKTEAIDDTHATPPEVRRFPHDSPRLCFLLL